MADLQIINKLPYKENIVYKEDGNPEIVIPVPNPSPQDKTIIPGSSINLKYNNTPQYNKTWSIYFKDQNYRLEMVDIMENEAFHHTLFRLSPTYLKIEKDCEITAQMGGITPASPKVDNIKINICNNLPVSCTVFTTINTTLTQTSIIPPETTPPNCLSLCFDKNYIIEVYFKLDNASRFAVSITINQSPFTVRKYEMDKTSFKLNHAIIHPEEINLSIEPD